MSSKPAIFVDADACPVKEEVYRVAFRREVPVFIVSNSYLRIPDHPLVSRIVVGAAFDAADDRIAAEARPTTVVVTGDILLADRCLRLGARVLSPSGRVFTTSSIGAAVAMRGVMADLRAGGDFVGGPPAFSKADRSHFLSQLDDILVSLDRAAGKAERSR